MLCVGGAFAGAAVAVLARHPLAPTIAAGSGVLVILWIAAQVSIIGYVSPLQPIRAAAGVSIVTLAIAIDGRRRS